MVMKVGPVDIIMTTNTLKGAGDQFFTIGQLLEMMPDAIHACGMLILMYQWERHPDDADTVRKPFGGGDDKSVWICVKPDGQYRVKVTIEHACDNL